MQNKSVIFKMIAYAKSTPCPRRKDSQKWNKSQQTEKDICYYRSGKYSEDIANKGELPIFDLDGNILSYQRNEKRYIYGTNNLELLKYI